jgi:hypothetical protein
MDQSAYSANALTRARAPTLLPAKLKNSSLLGGINLRLARSQYHESDAVDLPGATFVTHYATLTVHCGDGFDARFIPFRSTRLSR